MTRQVSIAIPVPQIDNYLGPDGQWQVDDAGDARGADAVDFQRSRTANTQVAKELGSVTMGRNSTATSEYVAAIGSGNTAVGVLPALNQPGAIAIGRDCSTAARVGRTDSAAVAIGAANTSILGVSIGRDNSTSFGAVDDEAISIGNGLTGGEDGVVNFGSNSFNAAEHCVLFMSDFQEGTIHGIKGANNHFNFGGVGVSSDAIQRWWHMQNTTSSATPGVLGYIEAGGNTFVEPGTWFHLFSIVAHQTNGTDWAAWIIAIVTRDATLVDRTDIRNWFSAGGATWAIGFSSLGLNVTTYEWSFTGTGEALKDISWNVHGSSLSIDG